MRVVFEYVVSIEDAAGNSRARERVETMEKNLERRRRDTLEPALRASLILRSVAHWLTPAAIPFRLCEPVKRNAKHIPACRRWDSGDEEVSGV